MAKNIQDQAKYARALFIWTDCDREGEHIGSEIRDSAVKGNPRIQVKRAQFSNIERASVQSTSLSFFDPFGTDKHQPHFERRKASQGSRRATS